MLVAVKVSLLFGEKHELQMRTLAFNRSAPYFSDRVVEVRQLRPEHVLLSKRGVARQGRSPVLLPFLPLTAVYKRFNHLKAELLKLVNSVLFKLLNLGKLAFQHAEPLIRVLNHL